MSGEFNHKIASLIDSTLLKQEAKETDILQCCNDAKKWNFRTVCVYPQDVGLCTQELHDHATEVCTVIDFPGGLGDVQRNIDDIQMSTSSGAMEIDMVMDMDAFRGKNYQQVAAGIQAVVEAAEGRIVKVIIETCLWPRNEIKLASEIVKDNYAHFVKTSTGFSTYGARTKNVQLIRETVGDIFGVKASGGIKNYSDTLAMIQAGANRVGTSSGVAIMLQSHDYK